MAATRLVIFGATGDLTRRFLVPALYRLHGAGLLEPDLQIVIYARRPLSRETFVSSMETALRESGKDMRAWADFARRFVAYVQGGLDAEGVRQLRGWIAGNAVFYLALPPGLFAEAAEYLAAAGLHEERNGFRRLVIEKPFGQDLQTARQLQQRVSRHLARRAGVSHRPLPRQGDGAEYPSLPIRQPADGVAVEPQLCGLRPDYRRRNRWRRRPFGLLRPVGCPARYGAEPPDAVIHADRDGAAPDAGARCLAQREGEGARQRAPHSTGRSGRVRCAWAIHARTIW
jgi:hypothetical protein